MNNLCEYPAAFLDIISPRRCLLCSCHLGHPLARKKHKHKVLDDYLCFTCQEQINVCGVGSTSLVPIDNIFSGYRYAGGLAQIIPAWKYQGRNEFFPVIEALLQPLIFRLQSSENSFDLVMAIPLTRASLQKRGFNQALFIASCCADGLDLPLLKHQFTKVVETPHQAVLDRDARVRNLNPDVFRVTCTAGLYNQKILLCDDVLTTGSTLKAAATALKNAGAESVSALTLARVE